MEAILINIIISIVLSMAATLLQQAFGSKKGGGSRSQVQIGGKVPQYFLMGTVADGGKREYRNSWGESGGVPNAYLTDVLSFGDLSITAMTKVFVNGVAEPVSSTGKITQGYPTTGDKAGKFWLEFFDGNQTSANSYLTGKFGSDPDRPWTSDMVGRGVPYLTATALWDQEIWTGFPELIVEFQGIKLYDPRKDSTAGGSGSQRWANPSTWAFSDNNAVMIYNIERGIYYNASGATTLGQHVWGGKKTAAELPYDVWAAAMDKCDVDIALKGGGTEKQFRAGRRIDLNERPADVIKELLIGANARISHASDGTVYILVGVPSAADGSFTDDDVLATEAVGAIPFPNLDEIVNGATATYREPSQAWEDKETAPYYRSDLETLDDGRRQVEGLDLGTTFSGTQAQRIQKAVVEEGRRFKRHVVALPAKYADYRPLQVLAWTNTKLGYSNKLFLITARTRSPWGTVVFGLQEIDPADHNWTPGTDEQTLSFAPVVINRPPPQEVSGFYVAQGNDTRRTSVDVFWDAASVSVDVEFVRVAHRRAGETKERWIGLIPRPQLLSGSARVVQALLPDDAIELQIQYIAKSGRPTVASTWMPITTPDVRLGAADLWPITGEQLSADLQADQAWIRGETRNVKATVDAIVKRTVDQDFANFADKQQLRTELSTRAEDIESNYTLLVTTAVGVVDGKLTGVSQRVETLEVGIQGLASVTAVNAIDLRLTTAEGTISTQGTAISGLSSALAGKADVSVTDALDLKITENASGLQTQAGWLRDARSTVYVNAMGQVEQDFANFRDKSDVLAATANVYQFADTQVRALNGTLELQASLIQQAQTSIGTKADATALIALDTRVGSTPVGYSTLADAVLGVSSTVDGVTGGSRVRFSAAYTPAAGWTVRAGMDVRVGTSDTYKSGGIYFEATTSNSRAILDADYVAVMNGGVPAALFQAGTTYLSNARIRDLDATNITAAKIDAALILQNGTAITDLIANNAVSVGDAVTTAGSINVVRASSPEVTIQTLTMTPNNGYTKVRCSAFLIPVTNGNIYHKYRLYKNGTEVASRFLYVTGGSPGTPILDYQDSSPGTASITWTFTAQNLQSDQSPQPSIASGTDVIHSRTIDTFNGKK